VNRQQYFEKIDLYTKIHNIDPISFTETKKDSRPLIGVERRKLILPFEILDRRIEQLPH
jgi:hypothetical protein